MSTEEKKTPDKSSKSEKKTAKKNKLDRELDQTFPASDPPSQTRPGYNRDKEDEKDKT